MQWTRNQIFITHGSTPATCTRNTSFFFEKNFFFSKKGKFFKKKIGMTTKRIESDPASFEEFTLLELQGELQSKGVIPQQDLTKSQLRIGKQLGKLKEDEESGRLVLDIGSNRLEGKRVKLDRPMAILKKMDDRTYSTRGLVTEKMIFKTRPQPLTFV